MIKHAAVAGVFAGLFLVTACSGTSSSPPSDAGGAGNDATSCPSCGIEGDAGSAGDASEPAPLRASDYDQACKVSTDCVAVNEGDPCACAGCGNAAINAVDKSRFNADLASRRAECPKGSQQACPADCEFTQAFCSAGMCAVCHQPGCGADTGATDAGGNLGAGAVCTVQNDQCATGLLCCEQGGVLLPDAAPKQSHCTAPLPNSTSCPLVP